MFFYNQRKTQQKNRKHIIIGALIASFVTGTLALLFAPKSGKELRKDIATGAKEAAVKTQQYATKASQVIQENTEELKEKALEARQALLEKFHAKKEEIRLEKIEDDKEETK